MSMVDIKVHVPWWTWTYYKRALVWQCQWSASVNATGLLPFPAAPYSPCMHAEWRSGETVQMSHGETP